MGITITGKNKETAKLYSALCSYTFEQEYGEMKNFSSSEKEALQKAMKALANHI